MFGTKRDGIKDIFDAHANNCIEDPYFCCSKVVCVCDLFIYLVIFGYDDFFCTAHFRGRTNCIPRYVYGSFCERMGSCCL